MTTPRRVVLVVGPRASGAGGVAAELRRLLPEHVVGQVDDLAAEGDPDAVVAVVSASAPLAASDWALVERAASRTDLVVGAVSKIDAHRAWRAVLDEDGALVTRWAPHRAPVPWVGVAAAPDVGAATVDDLVAVLRDRLADPGLDRRNALRRSRRRDDPAPTGEREFRVALQRSRLHLLRFVRDRCASMRVEFRDAASSMRSGGTGHFEETVLASAGEFLRDLDAELVAGTLALPGEPLPFEPGGFVEARLPRAPVASRRLETRLMAVLGAGFGLGVALASSRLLAGAAPAASAAGLVAGAALGVMLTVWVVRTRGLLHDRAVAERWAAEAAAAVKWHAEALIAERLLDAESVFSARRVAGCRNRVSESVL